MVFHLQLLRKSSTAAIYVSILTNRLTQTIPKNVSPAALSAGLPSRDLPDLFAAISAGTATAMEQVPGITPNVIAAVEAALKVAYAQAFKTVYLTSIAFGGLAIIAALFTTSVDDLMTDFVARKIQGVDTKIIPSVRTPGGKKRGHLVQVGNAGEPDVIG